MSKRLRSDLQKKSSIKLSTKDKEWLMEKMEKNT